MNTVWLLYVAVSSGLIALYIVKNRRLARKNASLRGRNEILNDAISSTNKILKGVAEENKKYSDEKHELMIEISNLKTQVLAADENVMIYREEKIEAENSSAERIEKIIARQEKLRRAYCDLVVENRTLKEELHTARQKRKEGGDDE